MYIILCLCVPFMIFGLIETACKWPHVSAETRRSEMYSENIGVTLCRLCNLLSLYVLGENENKTPYGRPRHKWRIILNGASRSRT